MKSSNFITKETALLESLMSGADRDTRRYIKNMHESFVVPYTEYLKKVAKRIDEAQLTADQVTQIFGSVTKGSASVALPDAVKDKFSNALPDANAGEVQGFEQKAAQAAAQVQDPAAKQGIMDLIKKGLQNPVAQKLILTGISGVAGVAAGALTGGLGGALGASAAGAITGGLMGVINAKMQGADWKSAGMAGLKGAAMGGAAGAVGGLAAQTARDVISGVGQQNTDQAPDHSDYQVKKGDTLSQIAKANNVSVNDIMAANAGQTKTTDLTTQGWNNPEHDAFTNLNPMGDFTGPSDHEYQVDQAPKINNPDRLATGQNIRIPNANGNSTYQDGGGTAADTWNKTQTGAYKPDSITTNHAAAWGLDTGGQGDPSKTAGLAHDNWLAHRGGSDTAVAGAPSFQGPNDAEDFSGTATPQQQRAADDAIYQQAKAAGATGSTTSQSFSGPGAKDQAFQAANLTKDFDPSKIPDGWTMKQSPTPVQSTDTGASPEPYASAGKVRANLDTWRQQTGSPNAPAMAQAGPDLDTPSDYTDTPIELSPKGGTEPGINRLTGKPISSGPTWDEMTPDQQAATLAKQQQQSHDAAQGTKNAQDYWKNKPSYTRSLKSSKQPTKPMLEYVDRYLTVRMWALNESLGKARGGVYLSEAGLGGVLSSIGNFFKKKATGGAGSGPTAETLQQAWVKEGSNLDSDKLVEFLKKQGIPEEAILAAYKEMGIPYGAGAAPGPDAGRVEPTMEPVAQPAAPTAQEPAAPTAQAPAGDQAAQAAQAQQPASTGTVFDNPDQLAKDFEEYMSSGGKISPQFRGALQYALKTGFKVVESKQRKLLKILKEARRIDGEIKKIKKQRV